MRHVLFSGCSFTFGSGWELESKDPNLWVNLLYQNTELLQHHLLNSAKGGRSNAGIFSDTVYNLTHKDCEYAFVAWTSSPRYEMELGLETYETRHVITANSTGRYYNLNDFNYTPDYLNNIRDRLISLSHPHYEILTLVYYINSLVALAKLTNTKIFFINGICPWDQNYFNRLHNVLPAEYTPFTQKIMNVNNRCDDECKQIYNKLHNQYEEFGGIHEDKWVNLYSSFHSNQIDVNYDNQHPGRQSNYNYYITVKNFLNTQTI
jgi:hypothetical protein